MKLSDIRTGKIISRIGLTLAFSTGIAVSCNDDFLEVTNPDVLNTESIPSSVEDIDFLVTDVYGRMRNGFLDAYPQARVGYGVSHYADQAYSDLDFDAGAQINFTTSNNDVREIWFKHYENITRANNALDALERFRSQGENLTDAVLQTLAYREGELKFLRAWNYYYLINFFGESFITAPGDEAKLGVPIVKEVATSLSETISQRATVGEVWNFIKSDLRSAQTLLQDKVWTGNDVARINIWAVKSFLGKALVFTQKWDSARLVLADVINNSGKKLVAYDVYRDMFLNKNQFNEESILELNFNDRSVNGDWSNASNASTYFPILISPTFVTQNDDGSESRGCNGFCNFIIHDKSLLRFGWADTTKVNYKQTRFRTVVETARSSQSVDPRLWVSAQLPRVDSLYINNNDVAVEKNGGEGIANKIKSLYGWSFRKHTLTNRDVWSGPSLQIAMNLQWLRLADIYLLYAEANVRTGDEATALEYINKVKRRAYGYPVDSPSPVDYTSLTDETSASAQDPLHNDPLKYERWVELFGEQGNWWFDVCRWKIGASEAAYYSEVATAPLVWNDRKYALPIPQDEINANQAIEQNPGY